MESWQLWINRSGVRLGVLVAIFWYAKDDGWIFGWLIIGDWMVSVCTSMERIRSAIDACIGKCRVDHAYCGNTK